MKPAIYEVEDPEKERPFEKSFRDCTRYLGAEQNYHLHGDEDETGGAAGSEIWEACERLDIQSGIGHYAILLIGIDDDKDLSTPVAGYEDVDGNYALSPMRLARMTGPTYPNNVPTPAPNPQGGRPPNSPSPERKLMFLQVFTERLASIAGYEQNMTSPRYGLPKFYTVTLSDPSAVSENAAPPMMSVQVHWSRVIHYADDVETSAVFAVPRQRPVMRRLLDLEKLYGGSAEMYWKGAFFGLSVETVPQLGANVKINEASMKAMMENYMNGLQRYLALKGMTAKSLSPQVVGPTEQVAVQIDAICITKGMPKRIFMGSERGELASSQDDSDWNERVDSHRNNRLTPKMVVPLINRLIGMKVLSRPQKGFYCKWPDVSSLNEMEKANVGVQRSIALANYVTSEGWKFMSPIDYFNRFLHIPEKEAIELAKRAEEYRVKQEEKEMEKQKTLIKEGLVADPTKPQVVPGKGKPGSGKGDSKKPSGANGARQTPPGGVVK